MFDTRIEIYSRPTEVDENMDPVGEGFFVGFYFAQRTESGGRENLFASRIVHENEVVFTVRWTNKVEAGMFVEYAGKRMLIVSTHEEGRRQYLHLKCLKSDAEI